LWRATIGAAGRAGVGAADAVETAAPATRAVVAARTVSPRMAMFTNYLRTERDVHSGAGRSVSGHGERPER
jgi:hypothetical protein